MSNVDYKSNLEWFLGELSNHDTNLIEGDIFEIQCDGGSSIDISITELAKFALESISNNRDFAIYKMNEAVKNIVVPTLKNQKVEFYKCGVRDLAKEFEVAVNK